MQLKTRWQHFVTIIKTKIATLLLPFELYSFFCQNKVWSLIFPCKIVSSFFEGFNGIIWNTLVLSFVEIEGLASLIGFKLMFYYFNKNLFFKKVNFWASDKTQDQNLILANTIMVVASKFIFTLKTFEFEV